MCVHLKVHKIEIAISVVKKKPTLELGKLYTSNTQPTQLSKATIFQILQNLSRSCKTNKPTSKQLVAWSPCFWQRWMRSFLIVTNGLFSQVVLLFTFRTMKRPSSNSLLCKLKNLFISLKISKLFFSLLNFYSKKTLVFSLYTRLGNFFFVQTISTESVR